MELYRAITRDEYEYMQENGLHVLTGEKWFTTDRVYLSRVVSHYGRDITHVITAEIDNDYLMNNAAAKRCKTMPALYRRLPTYHKGAAIQIKQEKGIINIGFMSDTALVTVKIITVKVIAGD